MDAEAASLSAQLVKPSPPKVLIVSSSKATISFVKSILRGASITALPTIEAAKEFLWLTPTNFVLCDYQDDEELREIRDAAQEHDHPRPTIIHLFVPTPETMKTVLLDSTKKNVYRCNHPIRRRRLIQLMIDLRSGGAAKDVKDSGVVSAKTTSAVVKMIDRFTDEEKEFLRSAKILIAEDNPVAAKLLVKSLERLHLQVTATTNGEEAVEEFVLICSVLLARLPPFLTY